MKRKPDSLPVGELRETFHQIDFPDYQREPDIWTRDQKQRLIDSILRQFDIASIYFYVREDEGLECIDGRQRLNAIMSFLGSNPADEMDNGFALRIHNEIYVEEEESKFRSLNGRTFHDLNQIISGSVDATDAVTAEAKEAVQTLLEYEIAVVYLSGVSTSKEFNLQFLRLNLGTLINGGEKLHAMVGGMRNLLFESPKVGQHPFFKNVAIPTRRYAQEQVAAQALIQVYSQAERGEFTRARHFDLQKFVKNNAGASESDAPIKEFGQTLDLLTDKLAPISDRLRNRAITVSVVLLASERRLFDKDRATEAADLAGFLDAFLDRLAAQVENMKRFDIDERHPYLVEFQRHVTQASVEKPAVTRRHEILDQQFGHWIAHGELVGDS